MMTGLRKAFSALWRNAGGSRGNDDDVFSSLSCRYREPHRRYHALAHIAHCLHELAWARANAARIPDSVGMAIWFHDAVYDVTPDAANEERSARMAEAMLPHFGFEGRFIADVAGMVRASTHGTPLTEALIEVGADTFLDIDLAILGRSEGEFDEYERGIRFEHSSVPREVFAERRAAILGQMLSGGSVYRTRLFRDRYEAAAQANLKRSVARLHAGVVLEPT